MLIVIVTLSLFAMLAACDGPDDSSEQSHHGQSGIYIGGETGAGF